MHVIQLKISDIKIKKLRKFNKTTLIIIAAIVFLFPCQSCKDKGEKKITQNPRPNIVIIMLDDLGFSDISCYGSEIPTPNIDRLATNGLKYTQFRNAARCCPSRASLMTGLYPHQTGIGHMMEDLNIKGYRGNLSLNTPTIAEVLKTVDYNTYMAGKWHLTHFMDSEDPIYNWPNQRGFDKFYGTLPGYGSQYDPFGLMENNEFIEPQENFYYTDALTQKSIDYLNEAKTIKDPFFLYLAYTAPHYPLQAPEEAIEKQRGRFDKGWDSLRLERLSRLKELGIVEPNTDLSPRDGMGLAWKDEPNKKWQESRMEAYAGMLEKVDQGIGDIIRTLKKNGQWSNTLIFFLSDNGGSSEGHLNNTVERWGIPWKSKLNPSVTRDGKTVVSGDIPGLAPGPETTFGSYGPKWANLSNAPFRMYKSWVHEGGISSPFIVQWPSGITKKGELRKQCVDIKDIMATCITVSGAAYPKVFNGHKTKSLQGISLLPSFRDEPLKRSKPLFWEHEGNRAIIKGKWKLVSAYPGSWSSMMEFKENGHWELYNIKQDRTEIHNLSDEYPQVVEELSSEWQKWADEIGVRNYWELGLETY